MRMLERGIMMASQGSPRFSWDDVPDQLVRINSREGSLVGSGGVLTSAFDVSAAAQPITITGSPGYTASDSALNGAPSFNAITGGGVDVLGIDRSLIKFLVWVVYRTGDRWVCDGTTGSGRPYAYLGGTQLQVPGGDISGIGTGNTRFRCLMPFDGTTATLLNGSAAGTRSSQTFSGTGLRLGRHNGGSGPGARTSFFMACSTVPPALMRTDMETKLVEEFG